MVLHVDARRWFQGRHLDQGLTSELKDLSIFKDSSPGTLYVILPIALETDRLPLTRQDPNQMTHPPRASMRSFSSWQSVKTINQCHIISQVPV